MAMVDMEKPRRVAGAEAVRRGGARHLRREKSRGNPHGPPMDNVAEDVEESRVSRRTSRGSG